MSGCNRVRENIVESEKKTRASVATALTVASWYYLSCFLFFQRIKRRSSSWCVVVFRETRATRSACVRRQWSLAYSVAYQLKKLTFCLSLHDVWWFESAIGLPRRQQQQTASRSTANPFTVSSTQFSSDKRSYVTTFLSFHFLSIHLFTCNFNYLTFYVLRFAACGRQQRVLIKTNDLPIKCLAPIFCSTFMWQRRIISLTHPQKEYVVSPHPSTISSAQTFFFFMLWVCNLIANVKKKSNQIK